MKVFIFGKTGCARCDSTKRKVTHLLDRWGVKEQVNMNFVNLDTVEGLAEGSFYDVTQIPVTIVTRQEQEVARWDGVVPASDELRMSLNVNPFAAGGEGAVGEQPY